MKTKKISVRVTEKEKQYLKDKAAQAGYETESEYILFCCFGHPPTVIAKELLVACSNGKTSKRIEVRVTEEEKKAILEKAAQANMKESRYIRNCCLGKEIVVIEDLKGFARELNKVGTNLNQIARLCNEGLIQCPDIVETKEELKKIYQELIKLNKKTQPSR
ncbi:plasmid mobilization protein [Anaeromicropila populeti]|uniref:Mobilisation protein (MobC) n=1 Tax=Anaeromicropila populeti TaxID=37658 RepID=A0A1I6JET0_9FIRM|nr:plasmid mobilization relaxosome protein MobC [Anaeromicropila populeti]SFR77525.1 mobilisation protein (MobC) [Anaeromicropila populeti]